MKKILLLSNHWTGDCRTGGHFYDENMFQCLSKTPSVNIQRYGKLRKQSILRKIIAPIQNIGYFKRCKENDIVIINSCISWYYLPLALCLRLFSKTKILIVHHHFMHLEFEGLKKIFYKFLELSFLKSSTHIITVSPYIRDLCKAQFHSKDIRFWPIPFAYSQIHSNQIKEPGSLVYVGTIEKRKGLLYLLKSLKILHERSIKYTLTIIGKITNQKYFEQLTSFINLYKLNVTFVGFIDEQKKDLLLKKSQIFVFPSLLEGYGMVLREVMSYGLPIVCFNNSAMPYLVKNGFNGFTVPDRDPEKMANAIEMILSDDHLKQNLSIGAYETTKTTLTPNQYKVLLESELESI